MISIIVHNNLLIYFCNTLYNKNTKNKTKTYMHAQFDKYLLHEFFFFFEAVHFISVEYSGVHKMCRSGGISLWAQSVSKFEL